MDLRTLDLNLLRVLLTLIQEKNTYKAAERLHTSQPAISRSLARLRQEFDDPLFVRDKQGLKLTAKTEELATKLPKIFDDLQNLIDGEDFDYTRLSGKFRVSLNSYIAYIYGSKIHQAFRKHCPDIQLELFSFDSTTTQKMLDDSIELALTFEDIRVNKEIYRTNISSFDYVVICQKGLFPEGFVTDFDTAADYPYAGVIMPELNTERIRMKKALNKNIFMAFRSQQITPVLEAILHSPMMFPVPINLFEKLDKTKYQTIEINDQVFQDKVTLLYNSKHYQSVKYKWLEKFLVEIINN